MSDEWLTYDVMFDLVIHVLPELVPILSVQTVDRPDDDEPRMRKPSLRVVAAELEPRGHLNERGKRYAAAAISRMLASPSSPRRDALMEALAKNPWFKVLPRSGKGYVIGGQKALAAGVVSARPYFGFHSRAIFCAVSDSKDWRRLHGGKTLPQSSMNFPD